MNQFPVINLKFMDTALPAWNDEGMLPASGRTLITARGMLAQCTERKMLPVLRVGSPGWGGRMSHTPDRKE